MKTRIYSFVFALFALFGLGENTLAQATCQQGCILGTSVVPNEDFQAGATGFSSGLNLLVSCGAHQYFVTADAYVIRLKQGDKLLSKKVMIRK